MLQTDSQLEILDKRIRFHMQDLTEEDMKRVSHLMHDILLLDDLGIVFLDSDILTLLCTLKSRVRRYRNAVLKGQFR